MSSASRPLPAERPRRSARRTSPTTVGWLAIIGFFFLTGLGIIAGFATVAGFISLSAGLADPTTLTDAPLPQQSII